MGLPCVTLRENTERPITIEMGSNVLGGTKRDSILEAYEKTVRGGEKVYGVPPKWDGKAAERIWEVVLSRRSDARRRTSEDRGRKAEGN